MRKAKALLPGQEQITELGSRGRLSPRVHLVINPVPADKNQVTPVHQLEVGEESSAPGTDTTMGLSCRSGGEAYG